MIFMDSRIICVGAIVIILIIAAAIVLTNGEEGDPSDPTNALMDDAANHIKVVDGKLYDTSNNDKEIGTVKQISSSEEGENEIYSIDPEAVESVVSSDPLVIEYMVESDDPSKDGIYWMFGHKGDIFLAFNPTDDMGNGMIGRMTEFCKNNGLVP